MITDPKAVAIFNQLEKIASSFKKKEPTFSQYVDTLSDVFETFCGKKELKVALPFSGGLDSLVSYLFLSQLSQCRSVPFYIDFSHPYSEKEKAALHALSSMFSIDCTLCKMDIFESGLLKTTPTYNASYIPARNNAISAYAATTEPDVIAFSTLINDRHYIVRDCTALFQAEQTCVLGYLLKKPVLVTSVLFGLTKSHAVKLLLSENILTSAMIDTTVSCYHETHHSCGQCMACFRRKVLYINNGLDTKVFVQDPFQNNELVLKATTSQDIMFTKELNLALKIAGAR